MPNGIMTTREYVIEIHTNVENIMKWIDKHESNHKWMWGVVILIPSAVVTVYKILGG